MKNTMTKSTLTITPMTRNNPCPHCDASGIELVYYSYGDFGYGQMCPICLGHGYLTDNQLANYIGEV